MDNAEARKLLAGALLPYQSRPYEELKQLVGVTMALERRGASGVGYQIEIEVLWDGALGGALRVIGAVDDGELRAFIPLTLDFLVTPETR
ncbi:MAG TPA: hypothetical protein VFO95_14685 [Gemmatimonadales bacterium]|nr:hypothetical protein [Gemmatimonadales bacterium]